MKKKYNRLSVSAKRNINIMYEKHLHLIIAETKISSITFFG